VLGGFAIGARVALLWQHNANTSYKLASIPRYDDIVRTLGGVCASVAAGRDRRVAGGVLKIARRIWEADVAGWPVTGCRRGRGVLNITAAAWTAGFQWSRSGNITQTENVSEYIIVLALCPSLVLVLFCFIVRFGFYSAKPKIALSDLTQFCIWKSIQPVKLTDEVLAWLSVSSEVQLICVVQLMMSLPPHYLCFIEIQNGLSLSGTGIPRLSWKRGDNV